MDLNLFGDERKENSSINKFLEELKNALNNTRDEKQDKNELNRELEQYNTYEKKKIFLDNKSRNNNDLAWVMDNHSVCISEEGDGGPISIDEIDLPRNATIGKVYEKINGNYVYNSDITMQLSKIK